MCRLKYLFLSIICLIAGSAHAVFVQAQHYFNGSQHIYFFHDIHQSNIEAAKQQADLINLAKQLDATLLTEEMTSVDTLQKYIQDRQLIAQIEHDCKDRLNESDANNFPLMGLSGRARAAGIDARNVDYRLWADPCNTGKALSARVVMKVLDAIIKDITAYKDNVIFNTYYADVIAMVQHDFKPMWDYLRSQDRAMLELVFQQEFIAIARMLYNPVANPYSEHWVLYDSSIFNCLLLHAIADSNNDHIIVCAGAFHCQVVGDLLKKSGFQLLPAPNQADVIDVQRFAQYIQQNSIEERDSLLSDMIKGYVSSSQNIWLYLASCIYTFVMPVLHMIR